MAAVVCAAVLAVAGGAGAQPAAGVDEARRLYDRAAAAYERGDFAAAARDFAAADSLAPSAVALATAIDAATSAGDAVLAMTLRDRAAGRSADAQLTAAMKAADERFAGATGRIRVTCAGACEVRVDGAAVEPARIGEGARAKVGDHVVTIGTGTGAPTERRVNVGADALVEVDATAGGASTGGDASIGSGASTGAPATAASGGLSPAWFFVGLGATALAGAGAIVSGADTASKHAAFDRAGCPGSVHGDCTGAANDGKSAETRTNVLIGVTGALAAASAVVGIGLVRWSAPKGGEVTVSVAGAGLVVRGTL